MWLFAGMASHAPLLRLCHAVSKARVIKILLFSDLGPFRPSPSAAAGDAEIEAHEFRLDKKKTDSAVSLFAWLFLQHG